MWIRRCSFPMRSGSGLVAHLPPGHWRRQWFIAWHNVAAERKSFNWCLQDSLMNCKLADEFFFWGGKWVVGKWEEQGNSRWSFLTELFFSAIVSLETAWANGRCSPIVVTNIYKNHSSLCDISACFRMAHSNGRARVMDCFLNVKLNECVRTHWMLMVALAIAYCNEQCKSFSFLAKEVT